MAPATQDIPQPPRTPVLGHALSLDRHAPIGSLNALAKQLGPIFRLDVMGAEIVFVAGARLASELWDETRFDKAVRGPLARVRAIGGDGLFTAKTNEPNWAKAHNILLAPFGGRAMQSYHAAMVDVAEQLVKKWERLNPDEEIDVVHDMTALTLDTIGLCGFDYRFNSFYRRDYHPFVEALVRSLETVMLHRGLPLERLALRSRRRTMEKDLAFMNGLVDELVRERRGAGTDARTKKDLLNAMLSGVDKQTGAQLDDLNIRYQINTFLIAGHETTSGLLSYSIYALLKNPDVLEKARAEVDRAFGGDVAPTYAQVSQLGYINQILKESLRLWPPAPAVGLYALGDQTVGGFRIRKGQTVNVLIGPLQRDAEVWGSRADVFDPENFSGAREAKRPAWAFKPFGNGQRACIGRGFAMHEAALALGLILQRFDLLDVHRYQLKLKETLTVKPEGFRIKVRRRAEADRPLPAAAPAAATPQSAAPPPATRPTHNTPLLVLYGSNLGTAEECAHRLAETAEINGFDTTLGPLDDHVGAPAKAGGLVVFCASYNGAPPDNATKYLEWLRHAAPADAFAGVRYAVFGCGNSEWTATYQSVPRAIDAGIAALGGERIAPRGEGNAKEDLDGQYETWFAGLRTAAARAFSLDTGLDRETRAEPLYRVETLAPQVENAAAGGQRMRVLENRELLSAAGRSTRHIEIEQPPGQSYRPGDHLAVAPRNDAALVAAVAARFGLEPEATIRLQATPGRRPQLPVGVAVSVAKLLTDYVELQQTATRKHVQTLAEHTRCPVTRPKLQALSGEDDALYRAEVYAKRLSPFDLLRLHPACELPFAGFLEMLPPLQPRYYSISSSPLFDPGKVSITVGVVGGAARSGLGDYRGVASNYLATRKPGDLVHAAVRETKAGFRLPENAATPLVMIGPGTGLAPFRGFLRQRAAMRAAAATLGPAMLFFGCRRADEDFLYADELRGYAAENLVELRVAFSRPPEGGRTYVQDLMRREADALWRLIEAGAVVYVCGDGSRMEPDVKRALVDIHAEKTGEAREVGEAWIARLAETDRYVLDVWSNA